MARPSFSHGMFSNSRSGAGATFVAWRTILAWCLPALVIGFVLRAVLVWHMPYAFYHPDSEQVFDTPRLLALGSFGIHEKKTPLGPLLYSIPSLLRIPPLPVIAIVQHVLGLAMVLMIGALVAHSFVRWRLFIVPVTVLVAINPILFWYEHVALPETFYAASIVATALAGLLFYREPNKRHLIALGIALFCTAGFRPEGKLFCVFGLALTLLVVWRDGRQHWRTVGVIAVVTALSFGINRTRQSGSLLYSNVAHLTPQSLWTAPGFAEQHAEYFADLHRRWAVTPTADIARERKKLFDFVEEYIAEQKGKKAASSKAINRLSGRIGAEVCLRNLHQLPGLAVAKFRFALRNPAAEDFAADWVYRKQTESLAGDFDEEDKLIQAGENEAGLAAAAYGRTFASRAELQDYLKTIYRLLSPDFLSALQARYSDSILAMRLPDRPLDDEPLYGMPVLYLAAIAGLAGLALRDRSLRGYHFLWLGMLLFLAFVLSLTGSNLGRFRYPFEPFWFLYAFAVLDCILAPFSRRPAARAGLADSAERAA
jgi:hypothetical protein